MSAITSRRIFRQLGHAKDAALTPASLPLLSASIAAALLMTGCHSPSNSASQLSAPALAGKMPSSASADAVIQRARLLRPSAMTLEPLAFTGRKLPAPGPIVAESEADAALTDGAAIRAHLRVGKATANVTFAKSSDAPRTIALKAGGTVALTLQSATTASAEYASGYLVYRGGLAGGDVIIRPSRDGFEDHFYFDKKPVTPTVEYMLTLPSAVAGLRLSSNVLELLDGSGTPLVHASPPFLVDAAGNTTRAVVAVAGCAVDRSAQPSWGRRPLAPGALTCRVSITWDDAGVQYPAVLDPSWTTGNTMSIARAEFASAVIASSSPKIIAAGGLDASFQLTATVDFFDPATGTWSLGPSMNTARQVATAVYNPGTNEVLVAGGVGPSSVYQSSTEILSQNATTGAWSWAPSAAMRLARSGHTATLLATGQALIAGGAQSDLTACDLYDFKTHQLATQPAPSMHQGRTNFFAVAMNNGQTVLATGGYSQSVANAPDPPTAELYFAATNQWVSAPDMPAPHTNHSGVSLSDDAVMILGGDDTNGFQSEADAFTFFTTPPYGRWSNAGAFAAFGRTAPAALLANGAVVIGSGFAGVTPYGTPANGVYSTEADLYDPNTNTWKQATAQAVSHIGGAAQSVTYKGATTTVVFGGISSSGSAPAIHSVSELFTLTPTGQPCTNNAECVGGFCVTGTCCAVDDCSDLGALITLDATALSNKGLLVSGAANAAVLDTTQARQVRLLAGTYTLQVNTGVQSAATFTVTGTGTITYDPSLEGVLSGSGSRTLKVNGRRISVNAKRLSQPQLQLLAYNYNQGAEVDQLPFSTTTVQSFVLLPLQGFGYHFDVGAASLADLSFNIDLAGNVHIPPAQSYLATGEGTTTLTIGGAHVSITIPLGLGNGSLDGGITLPEGLTTNVYLLPYSGGTPFNLTVANSTGTFSVDSSGDVIGDPELVYTLNAHGDGTPFCATGNSRAEQNAWTLQSLNCRGPARADGSSADIDAPLPVSSPSARLGGHGRFPNQLPRNRKAAGGDPVLGDGEFFFQRVDASFAGYGVPYQFRRTYRSGMDMDGPLGVGWDHNYDQRLLGTAIFDQQAPNFDPTTAGAVIGPNPDGTIQFHDGEGNLQLFRATGRSWLYGAPSDGLIQRFSGLSSDVTLEHHWFITGANSYWQLTYANGTISRFDRGGFLKSIIDPAGNGLNFSWQFATPPPAPRPDCATTGFKSADCATWLAECTEHPIAQRRRLVSVADASRTVYYVYSQTDLQRLGPNDRLLCITLQKDNCVAQTLVNFSYDPNSRLTSANPGFSATPSESYIYHSVASDENFCLASPDIPNYCSRLCNPDSADPNNIGYDAQVQNRCGLMECATTAADCAKYADPVSIHKDKQVLCCTGTNVGVATPAICDQFLWGGATCIDGCEINYQCRETIGNSVASVYAGGLSHELNNDITDIVDANNNLVVHNDYGESRWLVSFDKVTTQRLGSASTDNVITFEYHDLLVEDGTALTPVYVGPSGPPKLLISYSFPDFINVPHYRLSPSEQLTLCPQACPGGAANCPVTDYGPPIDANVELNSNPVVSAVIIHDLHGLTRVQYLDPAAMVMRDVTVNTNEITDYNYAFGLLTGVRAPSGVRTCLQRDTKGRVTQSSIVPTTGFAGPTITQATTLAYTATGQLSDVVRDALGTPVKTHYERDERSRVKWIDQDVKAGAGPLRTFYTYDGEVPPTGILETPTQVTYPNLRVDTFSQFDASMGGPRSITIDSKSAAPEQRYVVYDTFGRVTEDGEIGRFAQRHDYQDLVDIWRLTSVGHRQDSAQPWIYSTIQSHLINGETIVDSFVEPKRATRFTNVGRFATQKDLSPAGGSLPATQTSCYNYSPDGRLDAAVLPEGNGIVNTYTYNTNGTLMTTAKGFGVDTSGAWAAGCRGRVAPPEDPGMDMIAGRHVRPGGFVDQEIDANHVIRNFQTDGLGRVIQISILEHPIHPDPMPVQQFGYDSAGHRIWEATRIPNTPYGGKPSLPDASVLAYGETDYDLSGRVTAQRTFVLETGEVLTKSFVYDDLANTVTVTDRGVVTTAAYDGRGRLTATTLPDKSVTTVTHQIGTDVATVQSNSRGNVTRTFNYDTRGLLLNIKDAKNAFLYQGTYDDDGNQLTETRAGLGPVTWTYDAFGRLIQEDKTLSVTPSVMATSTYAYDRNDRVVQYADAENSSSGGNPWTMTFSGLDAPLTVTDPMLRSGSYTYSSDQSWPHGLVASMKEPNGRLTSYDYDSLGRLLDVFNTTCPAARNLWECDGVSKPLRTMAYDARGNVGSIAGPPGDSSVRSVQLNYDSVGRVIDDIVVGQSKVHHSFADFGRTQLTDVSYGTSAFPEMAHRYDNMGRLHSVSISSQPTALATYDFGVGAGGPLSLGYSNGAKAAYSYDDKLRQTGIDVTFTRPGTTTSTFVASLHEAFGADSVPRMRQHKIGAKPAQTDVFQVDADGRITGENLLVPTAITLPTGEIGNGTVNSYMQFGANWSQYSLDKIGNIKQRTTRTSTLVHTVDKLSRLTAVGNTPITIDNTDNVNGAKGNAGQLPFTFDQFRGTLLTATAGGKTSKFEYDALDRRRVEHRSDGPDRLSIWDGGKIVAHGAANNLSLDVPGDDIDSHIVTIDQYGKGSQWFYHQGADQSTLAVTGSAGAVEAYTYSAFGELTVWNGQGGKQAQSAFGNIFQFQGQLFDALTGTYSMRARQHQPAWGQFLSPDPISTAGGPSLYSFTGGRPLQNRDPLGLLPPSGGRLPVIKWGTFPMFGGIEAANTSYGWNDAFGVDNFNAVAVGADSANASVPSVYAFEYSPNSWVPTAYVTYEGHTSVQPGHWLNSSYEMNAAMASGTVEALNVEGLGIQVSAPSLMLPGFGGFKIVSGGANIVYRGLAVGEDAAEGLVARAPAAGNSVVSHVAGARVTQWISTTKSLAIAIARFGKNGVVAIDLGKVTTQVVDLSSGIPGMRITMMLSRWAINAQEVLIQGGVPAEAIISVLR